MCLRCIGREEGKRKKGWKRGEGGVKNGYMLMVYHHVGSCYMFDVYEKGGGGDKGEGGESHVGTCICVCDVIRLMFIGREEGGGERASHTSVWDVFVTRGV